jgi:hypothetical protein
MECLKKWLLKAIRDYKSMHETKTFYEPNLLAIYALINPKSYCNPYFSLVHPYACDDIIATQILCKRLTGKDIDTETAYKLLREIKTVSELLSLEAKDKHLQLLDIYLNHLPDSYQDP